MQRDVRNSPNIVDVFLVLWIRDVYPGSRFLISYLGPGSRIQKQQQYLLSYLFLLPQISHNLKLFYFWNAEEKNLGQFSKNYSTFYPTICHWSSLKYKFGIRIRDLGSRKNLFRIPDPGPEVKKALDSGSGSATLRISFFRDSKM